MTSPHAVREDETIVTTFTNSNGDVQIVTDGAGAKCPTCGYPERHRIMRATDDGLDLIADGCPSCETPRPVHTSSDTEGDRK